MHVAELMTTKVITVEPHDLIDRVIYLLHYENIRHLPVVEKGKLKGIVSDRDLYKAIGLKGNANEAHGDKNNTQLHLVSERVADIMHRAMYTVTPETRVSAAASLMAEHRVSALPVVENDKLVGILSATDILRLFARLQQVRENREKGTS